MSLKTKVVIDPSIGMTEGRSVAAVRKRSRAPSDGRCHHPRMIDDVLALTADLPTRTLVAGETLFVAGEESSIVVVLVDGELLVEAGGDALHRHTTPGAFVGETGALLEQPRNATVTATRTTVVREIGHPLEFFLRASAARARGGASARRTSRSVERLHCRRPAAGRSPRWSSRNVR